MQAPNPGLSEFYQPPASTPFPHFVHGESPADFLAATAEPPPPPPGLGGPEGSGTLPAPLQGALQGALGLLGGPSASSGMRPPLQPMRHSTSSRGGHHSSSNITSDLHKVR